MGDKTVYCTHESFGTMAYVAVIAGVITLVGAAMVVGGGVVLVKFALKL